jgi:hypothetical protein
LNNNELINECALILDKEDLPSAYQHELLRRFTALAPLDEFPPKDPAQQDLFL